MKDKRKARWYSSILVGVLLISMTSCGVYSFSGAAISSEVETVTVERFPNNADLVNPNLSQFFTQKLRQKILQDTNLELVEQGGDLVFSGSIEKYKVTAETIESGQQATSSELTIGIRTKYQNKVDNKKNFNDLITSGRTFGQNESLNQVEEELVDQITDNIIRDIFNKSINNW